MRTLFQYVTLAVMALSLQACVQSRTFGEDPGVSLTHETSLPTPDASDTTGGERAYYIGPFDTLKIDVFGIEEMSDREIQADASGNISFPLAGVIKASGHTPDEVANMIADRLRNKYVRDPQVTVNLKEALSQNVTVDGQVNQPGIYPVIGDMTLIRAVAKAGGTTDYARKKNVVVFRTVDGQRYAGLYNLEGIRRGNYPDPAVYANDVVVVGDSAATRRLDRILQIVPLITSPLVLLLR